MKKILSLIQCVLLLLQLSIIKPILIKAQVQADLCSAETEYEGELYSITRTLTPFDGTAIELSLGELSSTTLQSYGSSAYFVFTSTESQYLDLNYYGLSASLTIYNYFYFNNIDYLSYYEDISEEVDFVYLDKNQTYIFEFINMENSQNIFSLQPTKLTNSLTNHENYILKIDYNSTSAIGYHYKVEYFDVSLTSATNTSSYISSDGGTTSYLDLISSTDNFNISNDNRRLVENPESNQYSSIAYNEVKPSYIGSSGSIYGARQRGTSTFVDSTTVIGCAHLIYLLSSSGEESSLPQKVYFYPGANSYYDEVNWHSTYGEYTAYRTYAPISYILNGGANNTANKSDWAISLTTNTISGSKTHSYMALFNFQSTGTSTNLASTVVQSAGYPSLKNYSNESFNKLYYSMWTSYPLENSVYGNYNMLYSDDIVISNGNSGGPIFVYNTTIQNGQVIKICNLIGIASAEESPKDSETNMDIFDNSRFVRMRPIIINVYKEVI